MARTLNRLSPTEVKNQKTPGYYADGGNLYFRVAPGGARGWIFRFAMHGRTRDCGLGPYPTVAIKDARIAADECRQLVARGVDPIEERKQRRDAAAIEAAKAMTFDDCAAAYIKAHEAGWRNAKHRQQWTNTLRNYVSPVFGRLPVQAVNTALVMKVIEPLWDAKKVDTAGRIRGRIELILDWATVREYRTGENPARWRGHIESLLPARGDVRKVQHHPALPYAELPAFLARVREQQGVAARALEFVILTAARTGETIGATAAEISTRDRMWTVPPERMKAKAEHRVPLSARALAIVDELKPIRGDDGILFPGRHGGLTNMAMLALLERMGRDDLTVHGFRSTFRDWAAERTNFASEVVEMALAHVVDDKVEAAYRRGDLLDKRRRLMDAWAEYCQSGKPATAAVIPLRA
jgi:integrase